VVWDETSNNVGTWTSDGCHLTNLLNNLIVFHCDRLGYYGLLQEVSYLDMNGNRYEAFLEDVYFFSDFFLIVILLLLHLTFAVCTERNSDTQIPRYMSEAS